MMVGPVIEFLVGVVLAVGTLRDVFDTVVVPGESRGSLKIARRLVFLTIPLWRRPPSRRHNGGVSTSFAPFVLVGSFIIWMLLLVLGFGLMTHALRDSFQPALQSFAQALYVAGSGLVTVGLSKADATGAARWVVLTAGFCGLAVMTMAVTYLLEVQGSIAERDTGILKLTTSTGHPPSGLGLLERYAELDLQSEIPQILRDARDWCARVQQSHAAHPSLIYFRSQGAGSGWPAALGAVMDLALALEFLIDQSQWRGAATLLREEGGRMAEALVSLIGLPHAPSSSSAEELEILLGRLAAAGYRLRPEPDREGFLRRRERHAACISAMAAHLGTADAQLLPEAQPTPLDGQSAAIE